MSRSIEEQIREGGFYVTTTVGTSMRPMLRDRRDRVVIRAADPNTLTRWDLPLYRTPDGSYLLHRIIGTTKDGRLVIRGDNTYHKEYVTREQIVGVVTEFYRGDRHVSTDSKRYRLYAALWHALYPLRKLCYLPTLWWKRWRKQIHKNTI